jgi:hypothetical protein
MPSFSSRRRAAFSALISAGEMVPLDAILQAISEELLEAFPGSPYGDPKVSESQAQWIAYQAIERALAGDA